MWTTIPASNACASRTLHGMTIWTRSGFLEGGHQLEKLEFALALAQAKGDQRRSSQLRDRIADLGGNAEEPGTSSAFKPATGLINNRADRVWDGLNIN